MPELPEVECLVRYLNRQIPKGVLQDVKIFNSRCIRFDKSYSQSDWGNELLGLRLSQFQRKGKFWIMKFSSIEKEGRKVSQVFGHLGMTGRLFWRGNELPTENSHHTFAIFRFSDAELIFTDIRKFGYISHDAQVISQLGMDPLDKQFVDIELPEIFQTSGRTVKDLLMDQSIICGLGNIYANEVLFCSGIHPDKKANDIGRDQRSLLKTKIQMVLADAVQYGDSLELDFEKSNSYDKLFYFGVKTKGSMTLSTSEKDSSHEFRVYGREAEPCHICGELIVKIQQKNRPTYYCPKCQI